MTDTTCHMSISLDGFVAGPDQSREHPLGKRGREVHGWHLGDERRRRARRHSAPLAYGSLRRTPPPCPDTPGLVLNPRQVEHFSLPETGAVFGSC
jgi:hypothetical protein